MLMEIRRKDPLLQNPENSAGDGGTRRIEFGAQKVPGGRQERPGFAGEKIQHGPSGVRQDELRSIADIAVVRRELPGGLGAQRVDTVDDAVQIAPVAARAFGENQGVQGEPTPEVRLLKARAVPRTAEIHVQGRRQRRIRVSGKLVAARDRRGARPFREGRPELAVVRGAVR